MNALRILKTNEYQKWLDESDAVLNSKMMELGRAIVTEQIVTVRQDVLMFAVVPYIKAQKRLVKKTGQCESKCTHLMEHNGESVCPLTFVKCPNSDVNYLAAKTLFKRLKLGEMK